jgi:hypothetical protein
MSTELCSICTLETVTHASKPCNHKMCASCMKRWRYETVKKQQAGTSVRPRV